MAGSRRKTRACKVCGESFSYPVARGTDRVYCSTGCKLRNEAARRRERAAGLPMCNTPGCEEKATRVSVGLCEACYCQLRRTGSVARKPLKGWTRTAAGYVRVAAPAHPMSDKAGWVYEHRKVMYDQLGPGPQACYWCGLTLSWEDVVIDHLNEIKDDNSPRNLVVSCNDCNRARGAMLPMFNRVRSEAKPILLRCIQEQLGCAVA